MAVKMMKEAVKNFLGLAAAIAVCQLAGTLGSIFTFPAIPTWYAALNKPFFTPPNWLFGPAWGLWYTLMGISLFLVWKKRKEKGAAAALYIFALQLFLNFLWSFIFFGLKMVLLAQIEIVLLLAAITWNIYAFGKISRAAAWLLVPYLIWVAFASTLNLGVLLLNP